MSAWKLPQQEVVFLGLEVCGVVWVIFCLFVIFKLCWVPLTMICLLKYCVG